MRTVLILGGSGMLGHMVSRILSSSQDLVVKNTSREHTSESLFFEVDERMDSLQTIFQTNGHFDYAINCIGVLRNDVNEGTHASVRRAIMVNSLFPHNLATLARDHGTRVIHISTDGVFASNAGICQEDTPCNCDDLYGQSKRLGEAVAPNFLNIRCSIIGLDPAKKRGLVEWLKSRPPGSEVPGFQNHVWNGVTTLQFAQLCLALIVDGAFDPVRNESPIHHFCPNRHVSKFELLNLLQSAFDIPVKIKPVSQGDQLVKRILNTRFNSLKEIYPHDRPMETAIKELASLQDRVSLREPTTTHPLQITFPKQL